MDVQRQYELLIAVFDRAPVMINLFDAGHRITLVNGEWEQTLGWSREEARTLDLFAECYPDPAYRAWVMTQVVAATGELVDYRMRVRDGRVINTTWAIVRLADGTTIGLGKDVTDRARAQVALQTFSRRLVDVLEAERRHIARELHDEIGQLLTSLTLLLENSVRASAAGPAQDGLRHAHTLARELMHRVRSLSLDLRPSILDDLGLLPALLWHFDRYTALTGVKVRFTHTALTGRRLDTTVETAAFRIIQEALTNSARHAQVTDVWVYVDIRDAHLVFGIADEGVGFDRDVVLRSSGASGIIGMRERARQLGGRLMIESAPGVGTHVSADLPAS